MGRKCLESREVDIFGEWHKWGSLLLSTPCITIWWNPLKPCIAYCLAFPLLGIKWRYFCTCTKGDTPRKVLRSFLRNREKCLSRTIKRKLFWHIHTIEHFIAIEMSDLKISTWIILKNSQWMGERSELRNVI